MKVVGRGFSWVVSLMIFIVMLTGLVIYSSQKMFKDDNLEKIKGINVLDLKVTKNIVKKDYTINKNATMKDFIKTNSKGLEEEYVESIIKADEFDKFAKDLIYSKIISLKGNQVEVDNSEIIDYITNNYEVERDKAKEFIENIDSLFEFDGSVIKEINNFNVMFTIVIVLGLVLLCGLLSFSLYYPLVNLGVPMILVGIITLMIKSAVVVELFENILLLNTEIVTTLLMSERLLGIILIVSGVILIGLFILIKYFIERKNDLDKTRRFNIEDINI